MQKMDSARKGNAGNEKFKEIRLLLPRNTEQTDTIIRPWWVCYSSAIL